MTRSQSINVTQIWSAWIQGRDNAPESVQLILSLWEELNSTSKFCVLEGEQISDIIADLGIDPHHLTPQVKTNIVRTYLLSKHGGAWVDSTLLPVVPLQEWLTADLAAGGFFAFKSTGHPSLILQNWFLYSEPSCLLTKRWLDLYCDYFRIRRYQYPSKRVILTPSALDMLKARSAIREQDYLYFVDPKRGRNCKVYPYAIHNFTLAHLLDEDQEVRNIWRLVPDIFHIMPSLLGNCAADHDTEASVFQSLALSILPLAPVHKLNHRDRRFASLISRACMEDIIKV